MTTILILNIILCLAIVTAIVGVCLAGIRLDARSQRKLRQPATRSRARQAGSLRSGYAAAQVPATVSRSTR